MYPEQVNNNYEGDGILLYGLQGTNFYKEIEKSEAMTREDERLMVAEKTFPMDKEVMSVEEQADMILRQMCFNIGAKWADENPDGKMLLHVLNKGVKQGKHEMLDRVCEFIAKNHCNYAKNALGEEYLIDDFKKAMEE